MEEVAEGYLYELVNRSLLQVVERNESCRMHDISRLLALTKANEEGFCKVYDGIGSSSAEKTRRLSIHSANIKQLKEPTELTVRSIYDFSNGLTIDLLKFLLKYFYLLSTLDHQGAQIVELPDVVFNLFNLRFLSRQNTEVRSIPNTVAKLFTMLNCWLCQRVFRHSES